jgi:hypothetical protein
MAACTKPTWVFSPFTIDPMATGIIEPSNVMAKIPNDTVANAAHMRIIDSLFLFSFMRTSSLNF